MKNLKNIYLFVYLFIYSFIYLFIHLFIYQYILYIISLSIYWFWPKKFDYLLPEAAYQNIWLQRK